VFRNYIVERRTPQVGSWQYVREWDGYGSRLFCRPSFEVTETHRVPRRLWPGQTIVSVREYPRNGEAFTSGTKLGSQYFSMRMMTKTVRFLPRFFEWTRNPKLNTPQVPINSDCGHVKSVAESGRPLLRVPHISGVNGIGRRSC
jgi:hypothetical protein